MIRLVKLLHSTAQRQELRRHVRALYVAIAIGILVAMVVGGIIYLAYDSPRFWR